MSQLQPTEPDHSMDPIVTRADVPAGKVVIRNVSGRSIRRGGMDGAKFEIVDQGLATMSAQDAREFAETGLVEILTGAALDEALAERHQ